MFTNLFASILAVLLVSYSELGAAPQEPLPAWGWSLAFAMPLLVLLGADRLGRALVSGHRQAPFPFAPLRQRLSFAKVRLYIVGASLLGFGLLVFVTGWADIARSAIPPQVPGVTQVVTLLPYIMALLLATTRLAHFEEQQFGNRRRPWHSRAVQEIRPLLLPVAPYWIMGFVVDCSWYAPDLQVHVAMSPTWSISLTLIMLTLVFIFSPFLMRGMFPSHSLEAGERRERFEQLAAQAGVKLRDIRVWDTGARRIINACIAGPISWTRYIFLTDALLDELPAPELDAVFAHELGHAKHHHFMIFFGVIIAFLFALQWFEVTWSGSLATSTIIIGVVLILYFRVGFGALSRQLERQADFYSAELMGSWVPTARALEHVGQLSGASHRKGWRHPPIPERVQFLARCATDDSFRRRYFRHTRRALRSVLAVFIVGVVALSAFLKTELQRPRHERTLEGASLLVAAVDEEQRRPGHDPQRERRLLRDAEKLLLESLGGIRQQRHADVTERRILENLAYVYDNLGEERKAMGVRNLLVIRLGIPIDWDLP